jgi:hypothetical protein
LFVFERWQLLRDFWPVSDLSELIATAQPSVSSLAIVREVRQEMTPTEMPSQYPHLDILPERRYCHLECLLENKTNGLSYSKEHSIC